MTTLKVFILSFCQKLGGQLSSLSSGQCPPASYAPATGWMPLYLWWKRPNLFLCLCFGCCSSSSFSLPVIIFQPYSNIFSWQKLEVPQVCALYFCTAAKREGVTLYWLTLLSFYSFMSVAMTFYVKQSSASSPIGLRSLICSYVCVLAVVFVIPEGSTKVIY